MIKIPLNKNKMLTRSRSLNFQSWIWILGQTFITYRLCRNPDAARAHGNMDNFSKCTRTQPWTMVLSWNLGSKGWRSVESTRLPPMWAGFKSWRRSHMWVEFVVGSLPCSERFFSGYSGFPLLKTNFSKFQFDQESGRRRTSNWICYL